MDSFQKRVMTWAISCFRRAKAYDITTRCDRFIEEALELVQSLGYDLRRVAALVVYVAARPVGETRQEIGGVMVTLGALGEAANIDINDAGEQELARVWTPTMFARIQQKQADKERDIPFSPLPAKGCPCEPTGSDGLQCPDKNGRLLCEDKPPAIIDRALEYLRPHLESGTFSAPDWAINLASILTGGGIKYAAGTCATAWNPMDTAPKDGTMLRLLVEFTEHPTEDNGIAPTIGANNFDHDGEDVWKFAGWCWSHDHFTQGEGVPVGWLPMLGEG